MREVRDAAALILDHRSLADIVSKKPVKKSKSARALRRVA
jgi:hypothetical protein